MIKDDLVLHVEAALLSAGRPVAVDEFIAMFEGREDAPDRSAIRDAVAALADGWRGRSLEVSEVASGYRAQIRKEFSQSISALWQERPARYSRALLETLALIAYRQPISRGEIEEVRGVSVSSSIMKTLIEREWVRVVGHREVPGRPGLYGTTKHFLDTFNLKGLEALPPLAELRDLEDPPPDLFAELQGVPVAGEEPEPLDASVPAAMPVDDTAATPDTPVQDLASVDGEPEPVGDAGAKATGEVPELPGVGTVARMQADDAVTGPDTFGLQLPPVDSDSEPTGETRERLESDRGSALLTSDHRPVEIVVNGDAAASAPDTGADGAERAD